MDLSNLKPAIGSTKNRKRLGRGQGSGTGKTSGKGHKGQNARSGGGVKPGFEGGQMPLQRRLPKRGFTPLTRKEYALVNLRDLAQFEPGSVVDIEALSRTGLVSQIKDGVKILGDGELSLALTIKAHKFSKSAVAKIEAAGGKVEVV
jgi:large subunit ribosomal protein L15